MSGDDPWDPRRVWWQGRPGEPPSLLWRVEVARRNLRAARQRVAEVVALQERLDGERAEEARLKAYWASPAGKAELAAEAAAQAARIAAAAEWEARYRARLPILKAAREAREKRQAGMQPFFGKAGGRARWWHNRAWSRTQANRGRPLDMGGPREVWLTYGVPADPRLDNMWPVT